jgi:hypothetical protein
MVIRFWNKRKVAKVISERSAFFMNKDGLYFSDVANVASAAAKTLSLPPHCKTLQLIHYFIATI